MNREIKFRGLTDTEAPAWVYGCLVNNMWKYGEGHSKYKRGTPICEIIRPDGWDGQEADCWEDAEDVGHILQVIPESVGQYIGVEDVDGKEIYEGDIVESKHFSTVDQYFNLVKGAVVWKSWRYIILAEPGVSFDFTPNCKVIGSVHLNPELLNPEKEATT